MARSSLFTSTTLFVFSQSMDFIQVIHQKVSFGGPFAPDFIFNKFGPLKLATWSSLLLECSCIFLVWSSNKYTKYGTVYSMIALHIGIDLAMNMHVFEILSILGWCMFFIQPNQKYQEYSAMMKVDTIKTKPNRKSAKRYFFDIIQHSTFINIFVLVLATIFIVDTFPLREIQEILNVVTTVPFSTIQPNTSSQWKISFASGISAIITSVQTALLYLNILRQNYFTPVIKKYLNPIGLYQGVWDVYKEASDMNCFFTISIATYSIMHNDGNTINGTNRQLNTYTYTSPDWGTAAWYTKKRYQRPMTIDLKHMCRDCYVRYHANNIINDVLSKEGTNITNIQLASATLMGQGENPPPPPAVDDWFNWSGWFFADAKQGVFFQHIPVLLYTTNLCNDLNVDLCRHYLNEGFCDAAQNNHARRHIFNNGTLLAENDAFVYNITQTCRQSCSFCPEHGYDTNSFINGTRISIYWPAPKWSHIGHIYKYDETSRYYDCTIVQVRDRPMKQYLLKYNDARFVNEWFDPMTLRDLGYHLLPAMDDDDDLIHEDEGVSAHNDGNSATGSSKDMDGLHHNPAHDEEL